MTLCRRAAELRLPLLFSLALHLVCLIGVLPRTSPPASRGESLQAVLADARKQEAAKQRPPALTRQSGDGRHFSKQPRLAVPLERPSAAALAAQSAGLPGAPEGIAEAVSIPGVSLPVVEISAASAPATESISADGLRQYRLALAREARRLKRYPSLARERGWEGTAQVAAVFSGAGEPAVTLAHSSGHSVLDEQALIMIARAVQSADLPESLRGRQFKLLIPVQFSLGD